MITSTVTVTVDRPMGSYHPNHPDLYYPINYGYIHGIPAPDGEDQDAYILGINVPLSEFTGKVIAVIHRDDDIEDKWVVAPEDMTFTEIEILSLTFFRNSISIATSPCYNANGSAKSCKCGDLFS